MILSGLNSQDIVILVPVMGPRVLEINRKTITISCESSTLQVKL